MACVQPRLAVLVTTSNAAVRRQISAFVGYTGLEVLEAEDEVQAGQIASTYRADVHVCLVEGDPQAALAVLHSARQRHPFATGLVMTAQPESIDRETAAVAGLVCIEKPFAWRELELRLAERVNTSLNARHRELMQRSAQLIEECREMCAASAAVLGRSQASRMVPAA